jgi:hypothetical protein
VGEHDGGVSTESIRRSTRIRIADGRGTTTGVEDGTAAKTERYRETSETETVRFSRESTGEFETRRERPSRREEEKDRDGR